MPRELLCAHGGSKIQHHRQLAETKAVLSGRDCARCINTSVGRTVIGISLFCVFEFFPELEYRAISLAHDPHHDVKCPSSGRSNLSPDRPEVRKLRRKTS